MSASPNPKTDRISVAANTTIKTYTVVPSNRFSLKNRIPQGLKPKSLLSHYGTSEDVP
jgi:hypothetical protein